MIRCSPPRYNERLLLRMILAMKSSPAHSNGNNRRVTLKRGGISCYFKLMPPRESLRVAGSLLYSNDEAILESVKFEGFALAASSLYAAADSGLYSPLRNRPSGETRADAFDERELALGFHWPPWYSVPWLHLHAIYPKSAMSRRWKYTAVSFYSPDRVREIIGRR